MSLPALRVPHGVPGPLPPPRRIATGDPARSWPLRTRVAATLARGAVGVARWAGRAGSVLGGRLATVLDPAALERLARGRTVVLVTGTNGKTTTTAMIVRALGGGDGSVATNALGANMPDGVLSALLAAPHAPLAVLEVDESYLGEVAAATDPAVVVLLNLSRDQLDRVGEVRHVARRVGDAITARPHAAVVALADDVLCVGAVDAAPGPMPGRVVWISGGRGRRADAAVCPRCGSAVTHEAGTHEEAGTWHCPGCALRPPVPHWRLPAQGLDDVVTGPDGAAVRVPLRLPGRVNRQNAAFALAVAGVLGVDATTAAARLAPLESVAGRYRVVERDGVRVRLVLAKNPAGWEQVFELLGRPEAGVRTVVVAVNARVADGRDVSWLWDVDLARLAGHRVIAAGDRVRELSVRLAYAGVAHELGTDPVAAARAAGGAVELVGNYTAFHDAHRQLR